MKLTATQLRQIIASEVRRLSEAAHPEPLEDFGHGGGKTFEALEEIQQDWEVNFDEADPSMSAAGESAWVEQCAEARKELEKLWAEAYNTVQDKLLDGQYTIGTGMPDEGSGAPDF